MQKQIFPDITVDPKVRFGKPVIAGTRIPVDLIVGKLAAGMTTKALIKEFDLTEKQVLAALKYAATLVAQEEVMFT